MEIELAILKSLLERVDELAAKNRTQHFLGKKVVIPGANPARVIGREAAGRHDAMDMRMDLKFLAPGMQDHEEADFRTQPSRVARHFEKGFCTGAEQEMVEDLFVLQDQWRQATGQCENDMQVARGEQFSLTRSDPAFPSSRLTLRAVSVSAAIEGDGAMSTVGAFIEMAAECGGTTPSNSQQDFDVLPTDPVAVSFDERVSRGADQIGHLQGWPAHLLVLS
jgi:hypothetical protein